jgi:methylenetetrahydrofolate reductase (NADPH)
MKNNCKLANAIESEEFIITAEYLPQASVDGSEVKAAVGSFDGKLTAVNAADNPFGVGMSSLAAALKMADAGIEPVYQIVTRDRNRIAIQSDLLGAASLGIKNVLCLSGYHQTLTDCPESANVYDIDSIQLIAAVEALCKDGVLLDGKKVTGEFSMLAGAAANPDVRPLELNILRLAKKVEAGAAFIQTQAVFNTESFFEWLKAADKEGITEKTAILAGVMPLSSADEAMELREKFTDFRIPDAVVERLKAAGDEGAQKKEGIKICAETISAVKVMKGLRGIHILSGGNEPVVPEVLSTAGL